MKAITILTSLVITFTLAACSNNESQPTPDELPSSNGASVESELKKESSEQTSFGEGMSNTVAAIMPDSQKQQTIYLWEEGNMPSDTEYTENSGNYADEPDFRPNLITIPVPSGTEIKGAVLINSGGGFQFRGNQNEGFPVAEELSKLGYQSFVVNYRLRPYTQEEGALDLARAVRFVRTNAEEYGIEENDIAVIGFSAGGILSGEMLLNFDGDVNGTALDPDYVPDELDKVSADASAAGMIYSFYGRLSIASTDVEKFKASDLPPTYFSYGTEDPFVGEFEENVEALSQADVPVESYVLEGMPHGYGSDGGWISHYERWLTEIFEEM
jgi:acetyl esterase/lipase